MTPLVLSLFPGIGLLDRAFEAVGFCVVRGPDKLWGGDVRLFVPPAGRFDGVIGGPPCQDFSAARRTPPTGDGLLMLAEFVRVTELAAPTWWLAENVARVPPIAVRGFRRTQRLDCDAAWFGVGRRLRHFQFACRSGATLQIPRGTVPRDAPGCVLANDPRPLAELIRLQGLPAAFTLPPFTQAAAKEAIGNGVPLPLGIAIAAAVRDATWQRDAAGGTCLCGCGRVTGRRQRYYDASCRKRAQRQRQRDPPRQPADLAREN
jgi:DNA (cytosine-5)-methyltransferase 1